MVVNFYDELPAFMSCLLIASCSVFVQDLEIRLVFYTLSMLHIKALVVTHQNSFFIFFVRLCVVVNIDVPSLYFIFLHLLDYVEK